MAQVGAAKGRELGAWIKFEVSAPAQEGAPSQAVEDYKRALTRKIVDGKRDVKAHLVLKGYHYARI